MNAKVLITPRSLSSGGIAEFKPLLDAGFELVAPTPGVMPKEADLIAAIPECAGWLAGVEPVSGKVISAAKNLRVISRNGTGVDNLPMSILKERGIVVERAMATNARGVAELALAFMLSGLRSITYTHEGIRHGEWPRVRGQEICDSVIGVIGLGAIGKTVSELCLALGARVLGCDPFVPEDAITHENFGRVDLPEIIRLSDVITLHCPMPEDGLPLFSASVLDQLKQGIVLVNTARAGLLDEAALVERLNTRHVSSYLTDVFDIEPPKSSALTKNPHVTMTSHIGGFTDSSVSRSTAVAVENLLKVLQTHESHV